MLLCRLIHQGQGAFNHYTMILRVLFSEPLEALRQYVEKLSKKAGEVCPLAMCCLFPLLPLSQLSFGDQNNHTANLLQKFQTLALKQLSCSRHQ